MPNPEVVNIFSVILYDPNYWPCPKLIIQQSGYCNHFIPLFNTSEPKYTKINPFYPNTWGIFGIITACILGPF